MQANKRANSTITIDLDGVAANFKFIQGIVGNEVTCAAVVKANAYGLGANQVAGRLRRAGCRNFFVATAEEGLKLRDGFNTAGDEASFNILVLNGPTPNTLNDFTSGLMIPVLNSLQQIDHWRNHQRETSCTGEAALHIDTGMNRLGLPSSDVHKLCLEPERIGTTAPCLLMSHLACADDANDSKNIEQKIEFERLKKMLPHAPASLANSAGTLLGPQFHYDMVRIGIALYGSTPFPGYKKKLRQVVRLKSTIIQTRKIDTPGTVGYGATHKASKPTRLATVPVGYADGYARSLGNAGFAFVDGIKVPIVGRVSMDLIVLDITDTRAGLGDCVDLVGGPVDIDALADVAGTLSYEILTNLGNRPSRIYISDHRDCETL